MKLILDTEFIEMLDSMISRELHQPLQKHLLYHDPKEIILDELSPLLWDNMDDEIDFPIAYQLDDIKIL